MTVYFFTGMGADRKVFQYLQLPADIQPVFIEWENPQPGDTIESYALRLAKVIDTSKPFALVGLSFGGMVVSTLLAHYKPAKAILISSVACRRELPVLYRLCGLLKLNRLLPKSISKAPALLMRWLFNIYSKSDRMLLKNVMTAGMPDFTRWAMNEVVNWQQKTVASGLLRIHGDRDRMLPIKNFKPDYLVKGGGHFMVANRAAEVSRMLAEALGFPQTA